MSKNILVSIWIYTCLLILLPVSYVYSAEEWDFKATPYFWLSSLNGDVTVKGIKSDVDASFSDIFDDLNFGIMFQLEGMYKEKYGFYINPMYIDLESNKNGQIVDIDTDLNLLILEGGFIYNLINTSSGNLNQNTKLDLLIGGRLWDADVDVNTTGPAGGMHVGSDKTWFDFLAGLRLIYQYKKFDFIAKTDIGGFDLGFSSDISWNGGVYIGYELYKYFSPFIGYRALYADYDDGSGNDRFVYDAWMYGPLLGFQARF